MVVDGHMVRLFYNYACSRGPGGGLPVVFSFFQRNPWRQSVIEIGGQGIDIWFVHAAKRDEVVGGFIGVVQSQTMFGESGADAPEIFDGQTLVRHRMRRRPENLRQIDY